MKLEALRALLINASAFVKPNWKKATGWLCTKSGRVDFGTSENEIPMKVISAGFVDLHGTQKSDVKGALCV